MLRKIIFLGLVLLSFSCEKEPKNYEINVNLDIPLNKRDAEIFRMEGRKKIVQDSALTDNGKIVFKGSVETPDIYYILVDGIKGTLPIILENTNMDITIYRDSVSKSLIEGSRENDITKKYMEESKFLTEFNNKLKDRFQTASSNGDSEEIAAVRASYDSLVKESYKYDMGFIKKHNDYAFAAITLERLTKGKAITEDESQEIYNLFPERIKQTRPAKSAMEFLKKDKSKTKNTGKKGASDVSVGNVAPDFTGFTPEGKPLALKDIKAKVTIIDFWASWCGPCRRENPNVVRMYDKYHGKGLEIIGVSLDKNGQKDRWIKAIEKDGLTWPQVSNLKGWNEPIAVQYGVRSIPATFILDESGKIVATKLRGQQLEDKVAELLN